MIVVMSVLILSCRDGMAQAVLQVPQPPNTHWAFSAFFGTGWYDISDNRSVFIFRIPPRQTLQESSFEQNRSPARH
jgi:hypothetical protein